MDAAVAPARTAPALLWAATLVGLACAPVSWLLDGLTPSFVVYPLVLLLVLWRLRDGHGALFLALAAGLFWLIHLPWSWAALTAAGTNPIDADAPYNPEAWIVILFAVPLLTACAAIRAARG